MNKSVIIVGTGLGGLSTGLRLASRGYKVTFVEKAQQPGGRLNRLKKDGFTFDVDPVFSVCLTNSKSWLKIVALLCRLNLLK
jgi:phytoene dehydrogenase-like protein